MINFFWQTFADYNVVFDPSLFVSVLLLLGFLFSSFYFKGRYKPLWATLWIVTAMAVFVIAGITLFILLMAGWALGMILTIVFVLLFWAVSWLGWKFTPTKKKHRFFICLFFVVAYFGLSFFGWFRCAKSYGEILNETMTKESLEGGADFDYEIAAMMDSENVYRLLSIRVKGDSAYYQVNEKKA